MNYRKNLKKKSFYNLFKLKIALFIYYLNILIINILGVNNNTSQFIIIKLKYNYFIQLIL